jgi:hypothetical protein
MSAQPAHSQPVSSAGRWHNHLPAWIVDHAGYLTLTVAERTVLQTIADLCDAPDHAGNLRGCLGGARLYEAAGVSRRTMQRAITRLEALGFVICQATGMKMSGVVQANRYAVPAAEGALDRSRIPRSKVVMRRIEGSDQVKYVPVVHRPGKQMELPFVNRGPAPVSGAATPATNRGPAPVSGHAPPTDPSGEPGVGGSVNVTLPQRHPDARLASECRTTIPPIPIHQEKTAREVGAGQAPACAELNESRAELLAFIDRIRWRVRSPDKRRRALITRDLAHALRCRQEFDRAVERQLQRGERVRSPAALFDAIFTGRGRSPEAPATGDSSGGSLRQAQAVSLSNGHQPPRATSPEPPATAPLSRQELLSRLRTLNAALQTPQRPGGAA